MKKLLCDCTSLRKKKILCDCKSLRKQIHGCVYSYQSMFRHMKKLLHEYNRQNKLNHELVNILQCKSIPDHVYMKTDEYVSILRQSSLHGYVCMLIHVHECRRQQKYQRMQLIGYASMSNYVHVSKFLRRLNYEFLYILQHSHVNSFLQNHGNRHQYILLRIRERNLQHG